MAAQWRYYEEFDRPGDEHMRRDEDLARALAADSEALPALRLYTWSPYAISLGFQQRAETIDLEQCRAAGVDVVRRPTGGRAVFHAEELTYAVVMREALGLGISRLHNLITEALLGALEPLLGPALALVAGGPSGAIRESYRGAKAGNIACFASTARAEAQFAGRKVIGSAQRRIDGVVLQHGSILLGTRHLDLPDYLAISPAEQEEMRVLLRRETATLSEVAGREILAEEVASCLSQHFEGHICTLLEAAHHGVAHPNTAATYE